MAIALRFINVLTHTVIAVLNIVLRIAHNLICDPDYGASEREEAPQEPTQAPQRDYDTEYALADLDRIAALREEYITLLEAIQDELEAIEGSGTAGAARRRTTLLTRRASVTGKLAQLDRQREKAWYAARAV